MDDKKKIRNLVVGLTGLTLALLVSFGYLFSKSTTSRDLIVFADNTSALSEVSLGELQDKVDRGDDFFIFIGMDSCDDCQQFAKNLKPVSEESEVFFLKFTKDSTLTDSESAYLIELMGGKMDLPFFAHVVNGEVVPLEVAKDKITSEIAEFVSSESLRVSKN